MLLYLGLLGRCAMSSDANEKLLAQLTNPILLPAMRWTTGAALDVPHTYGGEGPITYQIQMDAVGGGVYLVPFTRHGLERFVETLTAVLLVRKNTVRPLRRDLHLSLALAVGCKLPCGT